MEDLKYNDEREKMLVPTNRLIIQPVRRDPLVLPKIDGNKCAEATEFDARSVTRKYNGTEENIYKLIQ